MKSLVRPRVRGLYAAYSSQVLRRARQVLGNDEEAEDALQDVFLRLIGADEHLSLHPRPLAWLLRVTTNLCLNRLRDDRRRKNLLLRNQPLLNGERGGHDAELRAVLSEVLTGVPDDLQQIAVHYHAAGMTCDEIAPLFGVSRRTIGNRLTCFQRLTAERVCRTPQSSSSPRPSQDRAGTIPPFGAPPPFSAPAIAPPSA